MPRDKEKLKQYQKKYYSIPENKEKVKEYQKKYYSTPENIAKKKEYRKKYNARPESKVKQQEYRDRPENKEKVKERQSKPENKAKKKEWGYTLKFGTFSHYSKKLSNADFPVCACCLYDDIRALNIDHIIPRSKLSASEKLIPRAGQQLWNYLKLNNYPKGYQILCYNCNLMKKANVDCPHKFDKVRKYWK